MTTVEDTFTEEGAQKLARKIGRGTRSMSNLGSSGSGATATKRKLWADMKVREREAVLLPMLRAGDTHSIICRRLKTTRSAISGMASRLRSKGLIEPRRPGRLNGGRKPEQPGAPYPAPKPWKAMKRDERAKAISDGLAAGMTCYKISKWLEAKSSAIGSLLRAIETNTPSIDDIRAKRDRLDAKILPLREDGLTASEIAAKLSLTKSAVCGVIYRARVRGLISSDHRGHRRTNGVRAPRPETRKETAPVTLIAKQDAFLPIPGIPPVPFGTSGCCRWSVDGLHGKGLLWCGLPRSALSPSYCASHRRLSCNQVIPTINRPIVSTKDLVFANG